MHNADRPPTGGGEIAALERQNTLLRDLLRISSQLSGMALQGASLDRLTQQFGRLIGHDVVVLDPELRTLAAGGQAQLGGHLWTEADPQLARIVHSVAEERRPVRIPALPEWDLGSALVIAPVGVGDDLLGYLAIVSPLEGADADLDLLTVEHAATVFALALMRQRMAAEVANRFKADLLEALLGGHMGDAEQVRAWARLLGVEPQHAYRVLLVVPGTIPTAPSAASEEAPIALNQRRHLLHALHDALALLAPRAIGVVRGQDLVVLAPAVAATPGGQTPLALARELSRLAAQRFPALPVAIGLAAPCLDPTDLPRALAQARQAVQIGRLLRQEEPVVDFERLGIYRLLLQSGNPTELRAYAHQVLGPLLDYDRRHQSDFAATLRAFFQHNASLQGAARDLVVHVNTVAYRMQRIEQLTGLDFAEADDRLAAQLALKILDGLDP